MIPRALSAQIKKTVKHYPIIGVIGPRQSGKTTLVKALFPKYQYVNLESIQERQFAHNDPKGFLTTYSKPAIFDEIQRVPQLFSELQVAVDASKQPGNYIITGSQHFLLMQSVSQSLAGRIALHTLLPLSYYELKTAKLAEPSLYYHLFSGGYPRIFDVNLNVSTWYANYVQTYIERDIRNIKQVSDLSTFQKFIQLCAGRTGQILNLSSLANDAGISHNTAKAWLSVLETSFIVFLLRPYYRNYNKRVVKSPKLYFIDPGLVVWLLGITNQAQLPMHFNIGGLFENWVISEYLKHRYNQGLQPNAHYWRDNIGREIDLIIEKAKDTVIPVEIKAGATIRQDYFSGLDFWYKTTHSKQNGYVIYSGSSKQKRSNGTVLPWDKIIDLFENTS